MSRSSATSHPKHTRQPQRARVRALALHTPLTFHRDAVCDGLIQLAHAWRNLDIRDERAWASYAADVAQDLARHLVRHASSMRDLGGDSTAPHLVPVATSAPATNRCGADITSNTDELAEIADELADCVEMCDGAADIAVTSLLHLVETLTPDEEITDNAITNDPIVPGARSSERGETGRREDQFNVI